MREPITREHWQRLDRLHWAAARRDYPTHDMLELRKKVTASMEATYGKCPPEPGSVKPPWYVRLGLKVLSGKLEKNLEARMDGKASMIPKWALALVAGVAACGTMLQAAMASDGISAQEWVALANAFVVAAWAKFSNPEKIVSPKPSVK